MPYSRPPHKMAVKGAQKTQGDYAPANGALQRKLQQHDFAR